MCREEDGGGTLDQAQGRPPGPVMSSRWDLGRAVLFLPRRFSWSGSSELGDWRMGVSGSERVLPS